MVDVKSVEAQLKRIKFSTSAWGRAEIKELPNILTPDEMIYECVNGMYDGGFALLVSTDMRVLLIDKKPLNFLTVEDLRFDMINEIDYSHRLFGAMITISAGNKTLHFRSYNQQRLRKLIGHVQDRMSEIKKEQNEHQENQKQHLAQINQQLQAYLLAQHQQLMQFQQGKLTAEPQSVKPSPELSDYLFAQSLLRQYGVADEPPVAVQSELPVSETPPVHADTAQPSSDDDLYKAGMEEIYGKRQQSFSSTQPASVKDDDDSPIASYLQPNGSDDSQLTDLANVIAKPLEINALRIAYAKLPMMLRNRKFGRPSLHAHSKAPAKPQTATQL